ncbi:MAG: CpXC domain-containing protein [Chloroflexota bacterium]|nr:CpXC domain-containing protein [Chloroflexota bacterium]
MSSRSPQVVSVTCPSCSSRFAAPIQNVIDVGRHPELKGMLLRGQLNVAVCPQCGTTGMLNVPFVYHDAANELLLVLTPNDLNLSSDAQQRLIGDMTNAIMNSIPQKQRKAYLLQPKIFLTLTGLMEAILQADGITSEMLDAQRARARLIDQFLQVSDDVELRSLVVEHDEHLDYDFFASITASIDAALAGGQSALAEHLSALRDKLLEMSSLGHTIEAQREALASLGEEVTRDELLEKITNAQEDGVVEVLIAAVRPLVDYKFFQILTNRIEAADEQEAERLKQLRTNILEITKRLDAQAQIELQEAASLLYEIWTSENREQAIRAHLDEIDDLFLTVLSANIQGAQEAGELAEAEDLTNLMRLIFDIVEESAPPQIRLINQLLRAEFPKGTEALLRENITQVNSELLEIMDTLGGDMEASGRGEVSKRVEKIRRQAEALLT